MKKRDRETSSLLGNPQIIRMEVTYKVRRGCKSKPSEEPKQCTEKWDGNGNKACESCA